MIARSKDGCSAHRRPLGPCKTCIRSKETMGQRHKGEMHPEMSAIARTPPSRWKPPPKKGREQANIRPESRATARPCGCVFRRGCAVDRRHSATFSPTSAQACRTRQQTVGRLRSPSQRGCRATSRPPRDRGPRTCRGTCSRSSRGCALRGLEERSPGGQISITPPATQRGRGRVGGRAGGQAGGGGCAK